MIRRRRLRDLAGRSAARLALVWAGVSIGVAFLATPAKFLVPSLSLPVALEVGRQTFRVYNALEMGFAILALGLAALSAHRRGWLLAFLVPVAVVAAQALWLLPELDARVGLIQAGSSPPPSRLHTVYISAEAAKILALLAAGLVAGPSRIRSSIGRRGQSTWMPMPPVDAANPLVSARRDSDSERELATRALAGDLSAAGYLRVAARAMRALLARPRLESFHPRRAGRRGASG